MRAHQYNPGYTVADYNMWEGDWELIDGYPYAMSPSASAKHQRFASKLHVQFVLSLAKAKGGSDNCEVFYELDWIINDNTVVRPDLVIVCNQTDKFITSSPKLVIEILSPSTALKDRHIKFDIYEEQGVPYYTIIDPETLQYNVYVLTKGSYLKKNDTRVFVIDTKCEVDLNLAEVLAAVQ